MSRSLAIDGINTVTKPASILLMPVTPVTEAKTATVEPILSVGPASSTSSARRSGMLVVLGGRSVGSELDGCHGLRHGKE